MRGSECIWPVTSIIWPVSINHFCHLINITSVSKMSSAIIALYSKTHADTHRQPYAQKWQLACTFAFTHVYACMHARTGTLHYECIITQLKEISCWWSSLVDIFLSVSVTMSLGHTMCHVYYLQWNNSQDLFVVLCIELFLVTQSGHGIVCRVGGRTHKALVPCFVVKHPGYRCKLCIYHPFWQFIMSQQLSNIAK